MTNVYDDLLSVDWNFNEAPFNGGLHSIHPYPAKFIPQIPRELISLFHPGDNSLVLDPFCGSGTTLVEAISLGLDAYGIDLNPLACLTSRVKTTPISINLVNVAMHMILAAKEMLAHDCVVIPPIPRVDHWFKRDIQKALACLIKQINEEKRLPVKEALKVALSSIIVRVSNQESDTRYAAIEKEVIAEDVFILFARAVSSINKVISFLSDSLFNKLGKAVVINDDILTISSKSVPANVGLVVTSPPYPNAYEYWLYHKYRMYWLGMDPIEVRNKEIGARPHYFGKNRQDENDFERQMGMCFNFLSTVMKPNAKACFVIGRSIIGGREIDNVALLQRASQPYGFVAKGIVQRDILSTRKAFNPTHGKIKEEHIIVFEFRGDL